MKATDSLFAFAFVMVSPLVARAASPVPAPITQVKWFGHAAFQITLPSGKTMLIDPWITNPMNPKGKEDVAQLAQPGKVDYILLTHGHSDHVGDTVEIGKKSGAKLIAGFELGNNLVRVHGYPALQATVETLGNAGGELKLAGGEVTLTFTPAIHGSGLDYPTPPEGGPEKETRPLMYGGAPVGFILQVKNGPTIYHSGDTSYFREMEVLGETLPPDLALLNIGGHFGMEPPMAARAATSLKAKLVVPHHFKTFPILTPDDKEFFADLDKRKIAHAELQPGGTLVFEGKKLKK